MGRIMRYHKVSYGMPLYLRRAWHGDNPDGDDATGIYEQLTSEKRKQSAPNIDWSNIDVNAIPAELVRSHPDYRNLLAESIERRHTIKDLKDANELLVSQATPPDDEEPENPAQETTPSGDQDVPAWAQALLGQFSELSGVVQSMQAAQVADARTAILVKHQIPAELHSLIPEGDPAVMEQMAQLVKKNLVLSPPDDQSLGAGGADGGNAESQFKAELMANLTGKSQKNLFTPGQQRKLGGGPVIN